MRQVRRLALAFSDSTVTTPKGSTLLGVFDGGDRTASAIIALVTAGVTDTEVHRIVQTKDDGGGITVGGKLRYLGFYDSSTLGAVVLTHVFERE